MPIGCPWYNQGQPGLARGIQRHPVDIERTMPSNYRPLSLLSAVGKLLENIINTRLKWLPRRDWFSQNQRRFTERKSTITAAYFRREGRRFCYEMPNTIGLLKGAFDSAWHSAIENDCPSQLPHLLRNVLTDREIVSYLSRKLCLFYRSDERYSPRKRTVSLFMELDYWQWSWVYLRQTC